MISQGLDSRLKYTTSLDLIKNCWRPAKPIVHQIQAGLFSDYYKQDLREPARILSFKRRKKIAGNEYHINRRPIWYWITICESQLSVFVSSPNVVSSKSDEGSEIDPSPQP